MQYQPVLGAAVVRILLFLSLGRDAVAALSTCDQAMAICELVLRLAFAIVAAVQNILYTLPDSLIHNRLMLSLVDPTPPDELSDVERMAKQVGQI